jgi:hypothetical protein
MLFMALDVVIYTLLALYLDVVLPRTYGVPEHPLFCLSPVVHAVTQGVGGGGRQESQLTQSLLVEKDVEAGEAKMDAPPLRRNSSLRLAYDEDMDVTEERNSVTNGEIPSDAAVVSECGDKCTQGVSCSRG